MSHLGQQVMRRILAGEGGAQEVDHALKHLLSCQECRTQAEVLIQPGQRSEGPLKLVLDMIERERQWRAESLSAMAEWTEIRSMASRRSQRDRVRMSKACRTLPFFNLVLDEIKEASSAEEAEFLAALAFLSVEAMTQHNLTRISTSNLQAEVWTAVANSRRKAAEWKRAHQALVNAERLLKAGTDDPRLEASLLSITASTLADEGQAQEALEALERCIAIYERISEWSLLARTLIKMANVLEPIDPLRGLVALDRATPLIPAGDSYLLLLAELLRVECLLEVERPEEALAVFLRCSPLLIGNPRPRMRIRGKFTCACLLDVLNRHQQAERLFEEVVDRDIEHELYKDAYLDLLYLYERHVKAGDLEKAARVCRKALTDPTLAEAAHDQMRDLWTQLLEAAQRQAISQDLLRELRRYFCVHWKHPAAIPPSVAFG